MKLELVCVSVCHVHVRLNYGRDFTARLCWVVLLSFLIKTHSAEDHILMIIV